MVVSEDLYKVALAFHLANLLVRGKDVSSRDLGLNNLPFCIAFFSSVDIDTIMRN